MTGKEMKGDRGKKCDWEKETKEGRGVREKEKGM